MFKRDRDDHSGIVVLSVVTFLIIFSMIGYFQGLEKGQTDSAEVSAKQHHENTAQYIQSACIGRDGAPFSECVMEAIKTRGEYQRAEYDLAAQQQMSEFAKWLLVASLFTLAVTAAGVYYVKRTLDATLLAILGTDTALEIASRTADASVEASKSSKAALQRDRAWLTAGQISPIIGSAVKCFDGKMHPQIAFQVPWYNRGSTPALDVSIMAMITHCNVGEIGDAMAEAAEIEIIDGVECGITGPGDVSASPPLPIPINQMPSFMARQKAVIIRCRATYRDIYEPEILRHSYIQCFATYHGEQVDTHGRVMGVIIPFQYGGVNTVS